MDAVYRFAVDRRLGPTVLRDIKLCQCDQPVTVGCDRLAIRHVVPAGVPVQVLDIPTLALQNLIAFEDSQDRPGGSRIVVGIPPEVEGASHRLHPVAVTIEQGRDGGCSVQPNAVPVPHVLAAILAVLVLGEFAGGAPVANSPRTS